MDEQKPALPPGVDFNLQEAMSPEQLQFLLRQEFCGHVLHGDGGFNKGACVTVPEALTPWNVRVYGQYMLYGLPMQWAADLDIRKIETADDFMLLVNNLNRSFNEAAEAAKGV